MDVLLPQGLATEVEFYPPKRPASATCRVLSPSGSVLASPTVAVDPLARVISAVTDAETIAVTGATGTLVPGRFYWWVGGSESRVLVSRVDAGAVKLEWPVAVPLAAVNDTLKGARLTVTVPATATATRGRDFSIEWTVTNADGSIDIERQCAHVVYAKSRAAVDVGLAKACVVASWPGHADQREFGYFFDLAQRASNRLWKRIRRTGRYEDLMWQSGDFEAAGRIAVAYELAVDGMYPANTLEQDAYKTALIAEMDREIEDVISGRGYDEDDSGTIESTEVTTINSIDLERE